jgi:hypothetical protein
MSDAIDIKVEEWHTSGDEGTSSLQEYLDMNDVEFRIWMLTGKPTESYLDRHPKMM